MGSKNEYLILPILQILSDGYPLHRNDIIRQLAARLSLSKVECDRISQEGSDVVGNITHMLKRAGLINRENGVSAITPEGKVFLELNPHTIIRSQVTSLPKYKAYKPVVRG